jgi:hypothetical protein
LDRCETHRATSSSALNQAIGRIKDSGAAAVAASRRRRGRGFAPPLWSRLRGAAVVSRVAIGERLAIP